MSGSKFTWLQVYKFGNGSYTPDIILSEVSKEGMNDPKTCKLVDS